MFMTRLFCGVALLFLVGVLGTGVYSQQGSSQKPSGDERQASESEKSGTRSTSKNGQTFKGLEKPFDDADKERLRLANKLLQEEIEDEKVRLEGLQKKLLRLKNSGIKLPAEDPELAKLQRENRQLQREFQRLKDEVQLLEEEVLPYVQKLQKDAGNAPWQTRYRKDMLKSQ